MTVDTPRASDVVSLALRRDAEAVQGALWRLELAPEDEEAVHDLRVGIRRMRTFLRACVWLYRRSTVERLAGELRAVAQATNALRDEEVLVETLELLELAVVERAAADAWLARRATVLVELRNVGLQMLANSRLYSILDDVLALAKAPPKREFEAHEFGQRLLREERAGIGALLPSLVLSDVAVFHRLRIRFKRLRYTADMLAAGMGGGKGGDEGERVLAAAAPHLEVARIAAGFQKELGLIHDVDVARASVAGAGDLDAPTRALLDSALFGVRRRLAGGLLERLAVELASVVMPDALVR